MRRWNMLGPWLAASIAFVAVVACTSSGLGDVEVLSVHPEADATGVAVDTEIRVTFNRNLTDASLIGGIVVAPEGGDAVDGAITFDSGSQTATFVPDSDLAPATRYEVTVSGAVRTRAGATMAGDASWAFETAATPGPDPEPTPEPTPEPAPEVLSVTIVEGDQTLIVGDEIALTVDVDAVGDASPDVTWSSSDEERVTVSEDGIVRAVAVGSATVTATSAFDPSVQDSVEVVVSTAEPGPMPEVRSVTIVGEDVEDGTLTLVAGSGVTLDAVVDAVDGASTEVAWESSDASVVTVDGSGAVTAVAAGSATVTAVSVFDPTVLDDVVVEVVPAFALSVDEVATEFTDTGATTFFVTVSASGGLSEGYEFDVGFDVDGLGATLFSDAEGDVEIVVIDDSVTVGGRLVPRGDPSGDELLVIVSVTNDDGDVLVESVAVAPAHLGENVVIFADMNFSPSETLTGGSVQWHTGATEDGTDSEPYDFNLYSTGAALAFFWPRNETVSGGVVDATDTYRVLEAGATIGDGETFSTTLVSLASADWRSPEGVDGYLGFRFENPDASDQVQYGFARLVTGPADGYPVTVVWWAFDGTGGSIEVPSFD